MIDLGKYASDVLLAYGISIGIIAAFLFASIAKSRAVKSALEREEAKQNAKD